MPDRVRRVLPTLAIFLIALATFVPTLGWGLPSRDADKYLFGDRRPWTGAEILALLENPLPLPQAGGGTILGADVDRDPILDRSKPVILNDTDAKRAAIVQRYRLMSGQPDEFIQFKALAEMAGRTGLARFDPRLYQYGGLWIYPVGALVRGAMLVGLIESPPAGANAKAFYLDHPEVFGKFYVVARAYSTLWGVVAALAVAWITKRSTGNAWLGVLAAACFIVLPVTRTAAHEAKPHLAGAALCLLSVMAATKYVETGRRQWLLIAGALCGAAMGMVVSMLLSVAVLPAAWWLGRKGERRPPLPLVGGGGGEGQASLANASIATTSAKEIAATTATPGTPAPPFNPLPQAGGGTGVLLASVACAFIVYAITNPFVLYNAVAHSEILRSNLGNSTAMYAASRSMFGSTIRITTNGISFVGVVILSIVIADLLLSTKRMRWNRRAWSEPAMLLLTVVSVVVIVMFVTLSGGKPAEYARFGLVPAAAACVALAATLSRYTIRSRPALADHPIVVIALAIFAYATPSILKSIEKPDTSTTILTSGQLYEQYQVNPLSVGVAYEAAPWSMPPLDLFRNRITLVRNEFVPYAMDNDIFIYPANLSTQIGSIATAESVDWRDNDFFARRIRLKAMTSATSPK